MKNKTRLNLFFQIAYQIINSCIPIFTAPYLARTLGVEQLGVFSYTSSIASYFTLFAMLGTITYGTKVIASCVNFDERSEKFCEIYFLQLLTSLFMSLCYIVFCIFSKDNKEIITIQFISVLCCFFDVSWLFFGLEKFHVTIPINFSIRVLSIILIFTLVKTSSDLWIYTLIMVSSVLISQIFVFAQLGKNIKFVRVKSKNLLLHIKNNIVLFIPLLAMSIYHSMDKTMLGLLSNNVQSGLYYNADKVINIPLGVITGVGTVMLPRLTAMYKHGERILAEETFVGFVDIISLLCIGMSFGIAAISKDFVPIFFGDGYYECILLIITLSPAVIFKGISDTIRSQYLIPLEKEWVFISSVFLGAIINLILNIFLIKSYGAFGAIMATLIAEFFSFLVQIIYVSKHIIIKDVIKNILIYCCIGVAMFFLIKAISILEINLFIKLILEVVLGGAFYVLIVFVYVRFFNKKILALFTSK